MRRIRSRIDSAPPLRLADIRRHDGHKRARGHFLPSDLLSEGRSGEDDAAFPVAEVDEADEDESDAGQEQCRVHDVPLAPEGVVQLLNGRCQASGEDVSGESVSSGCRGGVAAVGCDHVIDCSHVDRIVSHANWYGAEHA